jgi:hypothetical protein
MQSLRPYVDADGKRWHDITSALEIIGEAVTHATLWAWATRGRAPWNLDLETLRIPLLKNGHNNARKKTYRSHRDTRLLISEVSCKVIRDVLRANGIEPHRPGSRFTPEELINLEATTREYFRRHSPYLPS